MAQRCFPGGLGLPHHRAVPASWAPQWPPAYPAVIWSRCSVWAGQQTLQRMLFLRSEDPAAPHRCPRAGPQPVPHQPRLTMQPGTSPGPGTVGPSQSPQLQNVVSSRQGPRECGIEGSRAPSAVLFHLPAQPEQVAITGTRPCLPACPECRGQGNEHQIQRGRGI